MNYLWISKIEDTLWSHLSSLMDFHNTNEFQLFDQSILGKITFGIYDTFSTCQCGKQFACISSMLANDFKPEKFKLVKCIFINSSHLKKSLWIQTYLSDCLQDSDCYSSNYTNEINVSLWIYFF